MTVDLTRKESLQEAKKALLELQDKSNSVLCTVLLCTKKDLHHLREISQKDLEEVTGTYSLQFCEVSAFSGTGLKEALALMMGEITKLILRTHGSIPFMSEVVAERPKSIGSV